MANPIKWTGGKTPLATRIVQLLPDHKQFIEPFAGGAAVLLKHVDMFPHVSRTMADLDADLITFWQVVQSAEGVAYLLQNLPKQVPTLEEFNAAGEILAKPKSDTSADDYQRAAALFIRNRASWAANMKGYLLPTRRLRRGMEEHLSAWLTARNGLATAHYKLYAVDILKADGLVLLQTFANDKKVLQYLDPPYLHATRKGKNYYKHEMTNEQHTQLLNVCQTAKCRIALSGYASELYENALNGWTRLEFTRKNSMAKGEVKRDMTECLWLNWEVIK